MITSRRGGGASAFQWYKRVSGVWTSISSHNTVSSWNSTEFRTLEIKKISTGITVKDNESAISYTTSTDATYPGGAVGIRGYTQQTIDWIFVRKAVATEPSVSLGTEEQSPGPVGYWSMDEGSGSTVYDKTARGNNGTISGATWKPKSECKVGSCLYFDGVDDSVSFGNIANTATVAGNLTISFWMKPTNITKGRQNPLGKAYGGEFDFTLETNGSLSGYHGSAGTNAAPYTQINTTYLLKDNQWTHVVYTRDVTTRTLKYYINGRLDRTTTYSSSYDPQPSTRSFKFGYEYAGYYQGYLDEVIIFPVVKSEQEIKALYAAENAGTTAIKGVSTSIGTDNKSSINTGLVGYWKMDESSWSGDCSTTSVTDSSGNGNNGVACPNLSAANASSSGKFGGGGYFDGNNDYVNISGNSNLNNLTNFTVAFWASASASTQAYSMLVTKFTTDALATFQIMRHGTNNKIEYRIGDGSSGYTQVGSINIFDDNWHHVVYSYDGKTVRAFVDGKKDVEQALSITPYTTNNAVTIGSRGGAGGYYLRGMIDEVRIYNRALSPAETQELYNFAPGPIAYYDFEEGQGTTLNDKSGNGLNGTWHGTGTRHYVPGKYGKAANFNGSDDYVTVSANALLNPTHITVSAWAKSNTVNWNNYGFIVSQRNNYIIHPQSGSKDVYFYIWTNTWYAAVCTPSDITKWNYYTLTWDGKTLSCYINGILGNSVTVPGTIYTTSSTLYIGRDSTFDRYMNGSVDEVRIYNYARTQKQIIEDMNAGHPAGGSPVGSQALYLKFDEGYGTTTYDSGSNRINGTITSCSWTLAGKFNKGINCNGGGYVTLGSNTAFDSPSFTYTFWIKTGVLGADQYSNIILGRENYTVSGFRAGLDNSGRVYLWTTQSGGTLSLTSNRSVTGDWHHIAITYDSTSSTGTIYIDGKKDVTATGTYVVPSGISLVLNGGIGGTTRSNSLFDEFKFYSSALSSNEIQIDYNRNASLVMGATSTSDDGTTASSSASRAYCVPGDTNTCNPPVGEWKFEEGSGGTVNDTSGNGNTGTWNGTGTLHWTKGKIGKAGNFDGSSDYVSVNNSATIPIGSTARTLEMWVYTTDNSWADDTNTIFEYGINGIRQAFAIDMASFPYIQVYTWGDDAYVNTGLSNKVGWWHLAVTYDGSTTIKTYINGILKSTKTLAGVLNTTSSTLNIGRSALINAYFDGRIDHVQFYDYARTPAQVAWDYNRGKPIAHWKFDECQGSTVYDSSGNGIAGTITIGGTGTQTSVGTCQTSSTAWYNGATGKFNYSLNFDGTDDYVNIPGSWLYDNQTVAFWAKTTWGSATGRPISSLRFSNPDHDGFFFNAGTNSMDVTIYNNSQAEYSASATVTGNDWHHFVVTWTPTITRYYVDGVLKDSTTRTNSFDYNTSDMDIGRYNYQDNNYFSGQIDDVQIFNYALTANQVKSLYNQGSAVRFGPTTGTP